MVKYLNDSIVLPFTSSHLKSVSSFKSKFPCIEQPPHVHVHNQVSALIRWPNRVDTRNVNCPRHWPGPAKLNVIRYVFILLFMAARIYRKGANELIDTRSALIAL